MRNDEPVKLTESSKVQSSRARSTLSSALVNDMANVFASRGLYIFMIKHGGMAVLIFFPKVVGKFILSCPGEVGNL